MKTRPALLLCVLLGALLMTQTSCTAKEFYVAPDGLDSNPGTKTSPFATLSRARDEIRKLDRKQPVTVWVRGGTYMITEPITLGPQDSGTETAPIIYRAYKDETPILSGGRKITNFKPYKGHILQADVTGIFDTSEQEDPNVPLLVFNGQLQQVARYPNVDPTDINGGKWAYVDGKRFSMYQDSPDEGDYLKTHQHLDFWQRNIPRLTRTLTAKTEDIRNWNNVKGAQISIFPRFNWWHYVLDVESFDPDTRQFKLDPPSFYEIRPGDRYFIRNLFEELDTPGEWYLDRENETLYFWPPEPLNGRPVYLSTAPHIIQAQNCSHVTFQGFTMECCRDSVVYLKDSRHCRVVACTIRNAGGYIGCGVHAKEGAHNGVVGCDIYDVGSYGILFDAGDKYTLEGGRHLADNNYIHHIARVDRKGKAIELRGVGHRVTHNLMHDIPQSGIYVWGPLHQIEYNHIRHTCLEGEDTGAIGGGAIDWLGWQGVGIRYNIIADTFGYGYDTAHNEWQSPHFTWALYPDWAASGTEIIGNIIVRAPRGLLHMHSGRDNVIENNIFVDGIETQIRLEGWTTETGFWHTMVKGWVENYDKAIQHEAWQKVDTLTDPRKVPLPNGRVMYGNVFRRNILSWKEPGATMIQYNNIPYDRHESDYNVVFCHGHEIRTGQMVLQSETGPDLITDGTFETAKAGQFPDAAKLQRSSSKTRAVVVDDNTQDGKQCLLFEPGPEKVGDDLFKNTYMDFGPFPFEPGQTYRFSVWLKSASKARPATLTAYSHKLNVHWWAQDTSVTVTDQWEQYEVLFRLPDKMEKATYKPSMKDFYLRLTFPTGTGKYWIDNVSLRRAETVKGWQGWQARGLDTHSVVADPMFVNPARDDYRLKPDSPALRLGFKPIPVEKIGPYKDAARASWPIQEAPGAREALARKSNVDAD